MDELRTILREEVYASRRRNGLTGPALLQGVRIKYWLMLIGTAILLLAYLLLAIPVEHSIKATALITQKIQKIQKTQNPGERLVVYTARFKHPTPLPAKMQPGRLMEVLLRPANKGGGSRAMHVTSADLSGNSMELRPLGGEPVIGDNSPVVIRLALRSPSLWAAITGDSLAIRPLHNVDF